MRLRSIEETLTGILNATGAPLQTVDSDADGPALAHGEPPFEGPRQYETRLHGPEEELQSVEDTFMGILDAPAAPMLTVDLDAQGLRRAWPEILQHLIDAATEVPYYNVKTTIASLVSILFIIFICLVFIDLYTIQDIAS
jgi:hypothetical protein